MKRALNILSFLLLGLVLAGRRFQSILAEGKRAGREPDANQRLAVRAIALGLLAVTGVLVLFGVGALLRAGLLPVALVVLVVLALAIEPARQLLSSLGVDLSQLLSSARPPQGSDPS